MTGLGAVGFRYLIEFFQSLFLDNGHVSLGSWILPLVMAVAGLIVGLLIYYFAREAKGHGVPEVMLAVATNGGRIRGRVAILKSLASAICIGSGGSAGREGPIVQIGSALGSALGQKLGLSDRQIPLLVACGASAGIAATFNAPIAGALFSLEVILLGFTQTAFSYVVLSSVAASVVGRAFLGDSPAFTIPLYSEGHRAEILLYGGLGVLAAYALGRVRFAGRRLLLYTILGVSMFPQVAVLAGLFEIVRLFGLYDSLLALVFGNMILTLPFTVWVLTAFMRELPVEIEEAAIMDGATPWVLVTRIFLPLMGPAMVATGLLAFIAAWNEFLFALSFTLSNTQRTVPVAIALITGASQYELPWGNIMAASAIVTVPLIGLVLVFQRRLVAGLTAGAVKG